MNPELARKLRDEVRNRSHRHHGLAPQFGSGKQRALHFDALRPEQVDQVVELLAGIEGLTVTSAAGSCLIVHYDLTEYTLEGLEKALVSQGFQFRNSFYRKIQRAFIYFWEETQLRNMHMPQRLIKKSNEVYVKAWEHHPHGDHDDTPADLREER